MMMTFIVYVCVMTLNSTRHSKNKSALANNGQQVELQLNPLHLGQTALSRGQQVDSVRTQGRAIIFEILSNYFFPTNRLTTQNHIEKYIICFMTYIDYRPILFETPTVLEF